MWLRLASTNRIINLGISWGYGDNCSAVYYQDMVQKLEEFMWDNHYKARAHALPKGRERKTIIKLKGLIIDMYVSGYTPHLISKLLGKDHTTIYYHLESLTNHKPPGAGKAVSTPLEIRLQQAQAKREKRLEALLLQKRFREEGARTKEAARALRVSIEKESLMARDKRHEEVAILREKGMALYKGGASYARIALELGVSNTYVQSLLIVHPDFRKHVRNDYNRQREILQYDPKTGNLVATYRSSREAAAALGKGVPRNPLSLAARGVIKTYKGFVWRYGETVDLLKFKLEE